MSVGYRIIFAKYAYKSFNKLPLTIKSTIIKKIDSLGINPRPAGVEKLSGLEDLYRIRAGDYRLGCQGQLMARP